MNAEAPTSEIEVSSGFESLSRTLRVAEVIRRRELDFVSKPGELVESDFETGSLSAAARKAFAIMTRKAGPEDGDDQPFVFTKRELRGTPKGNEKNKPVMAH